MTISIANHKHKTLVTYEILRSNIEQLTPRQWKTACLPMIACRTGVSSGNFVWYCQAAGSMTCAQASITFWVVLTCFDQCWATCSFFFSGVFPWSYLDRPCLRLVVVDNAFPCKRKCATMPLINPYPDIVTVWSLLPCGPLSSQGSQAFWHRQLSNVSDRFRMLWKDLCGSNARWGGRVWIRWTSTFLQMVAAASILSQFQTPESYPYLT